MTLQHKPVVSADMPRALGPYSQAVQAGDFVFVAGAGGAEPATGGGGGGSLVGRGPPGFRNRLSGVGGGGGASEGDNSEEQAREAFETLSTVWQAAGSSLQHVVKTTIFCADANAFATPNQLYPEYFPQNPPARSVPIVQLPRGLLISIEC